MFISTTQNVFISYYNVTGHAIVGYGQADVCLLFAVTLRVVSPYKITQYLGPPCASPLSLTQVELFVLAVWSTLSA